MCCYCYCFPWTLLIMSHILARCLSIQESNALNVSHVREQIYFLVFVPGGKEAFHLTQTLFFSISFSQIGWTC